MEKLTLKENVLFEFIESYQSKHGASPTVKEMRRHMKLKSDGFVVHCLKSLARKGAIEKDDTPRGIKLLPRVAERLHNPMVRIPVLGTIPAGRPVAETEHVEDWMFFEENRFKKPEECFVLQVRGDSMRDAGILHGDNVIVHKDAVPRVGQIVAALVDGESTVKRFMRGKGRYYLKAENPEYPDIYPEEDLGVQGVVVGVVRWY